jgi:uncharacterized protein (TIGR02452 family)
MTEPPALVIRPCLDDDERAAACRRALAIPRELAASLGLSAIAISQEGAYRSPSGAMVPIRRALDAAKAAKRSIPPDALVGPPAARHAVMGLQVANTTTMDAARSFVRVGLRAFALNFANGVNPGGGFLVGARAQEETLCRSSTLYAALDGDPMYDAHRRSPVAREAASDWVILAPGVPFFRTDEGSPLDEPWQMDVLTCAAPIAPRVGEEEAARLLRRRIHRVLAIAAEHGAEALVLGAWGCGAFGNDPARTAEDFRDALLGPYAGAFGEVVFAISDWSPERRFLGPFRDAFGAIATNVV